MPGLFSYTYEGISREQARKIAERFATLHEHEGPRLLQESVSRTLDTAIDLAQIYPPEKPNSGWKRGTGRWNPRTGTIYDAPYAKSQDMKNSWVKAVTGTQDVAVGILRNTSSYASYVMSRDGQAWMHKGVWNTIEDIVEVVLGLVDTGTLGIDVSIISEPEMQRIVKLMRDHIEK